MQLQAVSRDTVSCDYDSYVVSEKAFKPPLAP
jgi:hypothetical protein